MKSNVNSAPSFLWSPVLFKSKLLNYGRQNYWKRYAKQAKSKTNKQKVEKITTMWKDIVVLGWKREINVEMLWKAESRKK